MHIFSHLQCSEEETSQTGMILAGKIPEHKTLHLCVFTRGQGGGTPKYRGGYTPWKTTINHGTGHIALVNVTVQRRQFWSQKKWPRSAEKYGYVAHEKSQKYEPFCAVPIPFPNLC